MGAGAAIEDDQRAVVAPHLNTRRVAAVAQRDSTRLGQGSAGTPKPDIHPCTFARLRGAAPRTVGDDVGPRTLRLFATKSAATAHPDKLNWRSLSAPAKQNEGFHWAFSFDVDGAMRLQPKALVNVPMGCSRDQDTVRRAVRLHAAGDVHRIAPDVVDKFVGPYDPGHHVA